MNLGSYAIDDALVFYAQTQVFSTGVATDADSVPAYRVYEDETTTPLLTGTMALLDSANTAGLYSEQITLSAANGFEKGKCYSITITATVSSVAGATTRVFQIGAAVDAKHFAGQVITAAAGVTLPSSVASPTNITAGTITTTTNVTTVNGIAAGAITAAAIATDAIDADSLKADAVTEIQAGLNASLVRAALGMAAADLDTQLDNITLYGALIDTKTTNLPALPAGTGDAMTLTSGERTAVGTAVWATTVRTLSAAGVQAIWDALTSALTTANSIGKRLVDFVTTLVYSAPPSAAAIATQVDVTLSASHGSQQWGDDAGSGAFPITVTVTNGVSALENATVRVSDGVTPHVLTTNVSGQATFNLDMATYTVSITKVGHTFTSTTRTVTGSQTGTLVNNLVMTVVAIPSAPASPTMCLIYGYMRSQSTGLLLASVTVTATRVPAQAAYAGGILVGLTRSAVTDGGGLFSLEVEKNNAITPSGSLWVISCAAAGLELRRAFNETTIDLGTVLTQQ